MKEYTKFTPYIVQRIVKYSILHLFLCICLGGFTFCTNEKRGEEKGTETVLPDMPNEITAIKLKEQTFTHELISNGKIEATHSAELRFQSSQNISHIYVKNGDYVKKGQKIAELDHFKLHNNTLQTKESLEQARLELQDVLIGQGYTLKDSINIPPATMRLARLRSGYDQKKAQYELARYEEQQSVLTAPFEGIIANLFQKVNNPANTSSAFCRIIRTQGMETTFTVLESELPLIKLGDRVVITPYADRHAHYEGSISEINPLVDDKGMVTVKARVNAGKNLFEGMNVRVHIHRNLNRCLVVPKTAVVLRNGRQVIFTLKDGKSLWNYVQTGLENSTSYTITEGLTTGDSVIVTGNLNLAHESIVHTK